MFGHRRIQYALHIIIQKLIVELWGDVNVIF